ncbi:hypothetical protein [Luteolibacter marinus]|nr:hypothetical protein [Luteolibacter marinus]
MKKILLASAIACLAGLSPAYAARGGAPIVVVTTTSTTTPPVSPF